MKKNKWWILVILVAIVGLAIGYHQYVNIFDERTLKTVDMIKSELQTIASPSIYSLDKGDTERLFKALKSVEPTDIKLDGIESYKMTLLNKYNVSKNYEVFIISADEVYIKGKELLKVIATDFFISHPGFDGHYSANFSPSLEIYVDNTPQTFNIGHFEWAFKRLSGTWVEQSVGLPESTQLAPLEIFNKTTTLSFRSTKPIAKTQLSIVDKATGKTTYSGSANVLDLPIPEYDGSFQYDLTFTWENETHPYKGSAQASFDILMDLPAEFAISKEKVEQDDLIEVTAKYVNSLDEIETVQTLFPDFKWYDNGQFYRGYLPTNYFTMPGFYTLDIKDKKADVTQSFNIEVVPRNYLVQQLTIDPKIEAATVNDETVAEYNKYFTPSRNVSSPVRYYTEPFVLPAYGRLTTEFGETRYVNGRPTSYRHGGLDIAAPRGSDIYATNTGKVVLAMFLGWTGNTVVIDHGEGIFSVYFHLDELLVTQDQMVERAALIGKMGTTGFSTGSHLHFQISYHSVNLEPGYFIFNQPILEGNAVELLSPKP